MARDHSRDLWCVGLHYESQDDKKAGQSIRYVFWVAAEGYKDVDVVTMKSQLQKYPDRVRGLQLSPTQGK